MIRSSLWAVMVWYVGMCIIPGVYCDLSYQGHALQTTQPSWEGHHSTLCQSIINLKESFIFTFVYDTRKPSFI